MPEQTNIDFETPERFQRELDDLYSNVQSIRSSKAFKSYLEFISRFRTYSVFNTTLVYLPYYRKFVTCDSIIGCTKSQTCNSIEAKLIQVTNLKQ